MILIYDIIYHIIYYLLKQPQFPKLLLRRLVL